ncbi:MAG: DUF1232 domain-containing protein [Candidatus Aenigmatarchaeota archaeon]
MILEKLKAIAKKLKHEIRVYKLVNEDKRTPKAAKFVLGFAIAYTVFPIDIIPDFIPVIGYIDDVLISLFLVWIARRIVPKYIMDDCRREAKSNRRI